MTPRTGRWVFAVGAVVQLAAAFGYVDKEPPLSLGWAFSAGISFMVSAVAFVLTAEGDGDIR